MTSKCITRMLSGRCRCPSFKLSNLKIQTVGTSKRFTAADNITNVNGIPTIAYKMQNNFPLCVNGVT